LTPENIKERNFGGGFKDDMVAHAQSRLIAGNLNELPLMTIGCRLVTWQRRNAQGRGEVAAPVRPVWTNPIRPDLKTTSNHFLGQDHEIDKSHEPAEERA